MARKYGVFKRLFAFVILFSLVNVQSALLLHQGAHHDHTWSIAAHDQKNTKDNAPDQHEHNNCHECVLGKLLQSALLTAFETPAGSVLTSLAEIDHYEKIIPSALCNQYKARAPPSLLV